MKANSKEALMPALLAKLDRSSLDLAFDIEYVIDRVAVK